MTLLVACMTRQHVVVATDRRLTDLNTGGLIEDDASKLIVIENRLAIAYTGLANVRPPPRGRTDVWIVDRLTGHATASMSEITSMLATDATEAFRLITHLGPRSKHHAFLVAGWETRPPFRGPEATYALVSNALNSDGTWEEW